jgi:hypothetical protein
MAEGKDGKRIAIEIETGKSDSVYNIRKDLEAGFDEVISVALNNEIKEEIFAEFTKSGLNNEKKVELIEIGDFLE